MNAPTHALNTIKQLVAGALLGLLPCHVIAQDRASSIPERVRITARHSYEIPGLIQADGDRLSGAFTVLDETMVHVTPPNPAQSLTMPRPDKRIVGHVVALDKDTLSFLPDGGAQTITIPLAVIGTFEVSNTIPSGRASHRWLGVGVGIAAGLAAAAVADSTADRAFASGCIGPCGGTILLGATAGVASGITITGLLGRDRWRPVPIDWFVSRLGPP